jgi:hypothetical protein
MALGIFAITWTIVGASARRRRRLGGSLETGCGASSPRRRMDELAGEDRLSGAIFGSGWVWRRRDEDGGLEREVRSIVRSICALKSQVRVLAGA